MAKRKVGEEPRVIYRTEKFEVRPDEKQLQVLLAVSENLRSVWNKAVGERLAVFSAHIAPLYELLKSSENGTAKAVREELKNAYKEHSITLFDQINALTPRRKEDEEFARVPRNWQEETLDRVNGSFQSFLALRKNGDYDARTPREVSEGRFLVIRGRYGFAIESGSIEIRCPNVVKEVSLRFPIPPYQLKQLARASRVKQFVLSRDTQDLSKPGRYFISINYEIPKPVPVPFALEQTVFVVPSADFIGVLSPKGESVQKLWRPDKYWLPKIDAVEKRMKKLPGHSRKWKKLNAARRKMQVLMARQQLQNQREIVSAELLKKHGKHFVVLDLVVRSKEGKLADSDKPERSGRLGLNWSSQNTGSLGRLVLLIEDKVREFGGTVVKHRIALPESFPCVSDRDVLTLVQSLRESHRHQMSVGVVA